MRAKSLALLMLALGCGLVASIGITQVLAKRNAQPQAQAGATVSIFVAVKDISLGDSLNAELVKEEAWPKDKIPSGAVTNIEDLEGRRTRQRLYAGEPILENKLLGKGVSAQGASSVIPTGYRVVPVKVDSVSGSGLILPGDRVDVLVYLVGNQSKDILETSTRTVLQDIRVFAVNDVVELDKDGDAKSKAVVSAKTISLLVTPAQAAKVTLASEMGKIRLVMRGPEDNSRTEDVSAKPEELLGQSGFAGQKKESQPAVDKSAEKQKGLLNFLNQMKTTMASKQTEEVKPPATWKIRILQPDGINDVTMESDNLANSADVNSGVWRISNSGSVSFGGGTQAGNKKNSGQKSAITPPAPPPSTPPQQDPEPAASPATDPLTPTPSDSGDPSPQQPSSSPTDPVDISQ